MRSRWPYVAAMLVIGLSLLVFAPSALVWPATLLIVLAVFIAGD